MALVFADGFDHYLSADVLKKWTGYNQNTGSSIAVISPAYARPPGGMGLQLVEGTGGRGIYKTLPATYASFVSGFAFNPFANSSFTNQLWAVYDSTSGTPGGTTQLDLRFDGAGHLRLSRNGTTLATSTNVMSSNTWYWIEIKATINNTTGAYEVRVNGSSTGWIPAATNQNTRGQSTNNFIDIVSLLAGGAGGTGLLFDDFYFLSSTSPNNDFLGPQKITTCFPSGAGNYAQWTGNYAANFSNVNETAGDGDTTFNQSSTANQIDSFVFDDVPAGTVAAIQHTLLARQDAGAARTIAPLQRSSSTDYVGTTLSLAGSYVYLTDPKDVDPATSSAYTVSNLNAAEFGYKEIS